MVDDEIENRNIVKSEMASQDKSDTDTEGIVPKEINPAKRLINWMSMDDSQILYFEKLKDCDDSVADFNETESDDACDANYVDDVDNNSQRHEEIDDTTGTVISSEQKGYIADHIDEESNVTCMESISVHGNDPAGNNNIRQEDHENQETSGMLLVAPLSEKGEVKTLQGKETKETAAAAAYTVALEVPSSGSVRIISQNRKPLKVAFCPKEVKRIIESEALVLKNAQSHTIRKIIVFASLGIRHGCEDMYELDFNHFSILKKGEPYVSPMNPGVSEIITKFHSKIT